MLACTCVGMARSAWHAAISPLIAPLPGGVYRAADWVASNHAITT